MVLEKILSIFVIMAIGFAAKKFKAVDAVFLRGLSAFMVNIALPFAFMASLDRGIPKSVLPELGIMALWAFAIHGASIGLASFAYRRFPDNQRKVLSFITVFTNCAFMGLPVAQSVAGTKGMMFASIYNVAYMILVYTYGLSLFQEKAEKGRLKKILLNPGIIAITIGVILWFLPFSLPAFFLESVGLMAKLQTPLAMFIVGANIANIRIERILPEKALLVAIAVRLVCIPLAVYGVIKLTGSTGLAPGIALILTAMPAGAQTVVVAESVGADSSFASEVVFATTILSVFTIPFFAGLVV
ncbi:MAG TPA: AEC family transporter [Rectinemataceae bacterium]|nr:AEC family transporter [Rectinemataceae bacterium]